MSPLLLQRAQISWVCNHSHSELLSRPTDTHHGRENSGAVCLHVFQCSCQPHRGPLRSWKNQAWCRKETADIMRNAAGDLMAGGAPAQPAATSADGLLEELSGLSLAQPNGHVDGAANHAADMFGGLAFTGETSCKAIRHS